MHDTLVWKAAALALIGDEEGARRAANDFLAGRRAQWSGEPPDDREIVDWIMRGLPIKETDTRRRLEGALKLAGLPVG
jgi:hypothetical protein